MPNARFKMLDRAKMAETQRAGSAAETRPVRFRGAGFVQVRVEALVVQYAALAHQLQKLINAGG